jgi:copper chaperone CopZ
MTVTLTVPSIQCNACAQGVRTALANAPGIWSVNIDVAGKTVLVDFDADRIALAEIETRLANADFAVESHEVG